MDLTPRATLSSRFEALALPKAKTYADFIRTGERGGPIPCWGALAERFQRDFTQAADRKDVWSALLDVGDRRALLLFLHMSRDRAEVMDAVLADAHRLPPSLQCALVAFDEIAERLPAHLDRLAPAARQIFEAGPETRMREREVVEARVAALKAFRYFVPDHDDPRNEPGAKSAMSGEATTPAGAETGASTGGR